jgi:hypothetical protein
MAFDEKTDTVNQICSDIDKKDSEIAKVVQIFSKYRTELIDEIVKTNENNEIELFKKIADKYDLYEDIVTLLEGGEDNIDLLKAEIHTAMGIFNNRIDVLGGYVIAKNKEKQLKFFREKVKEYNLYAELIKSHNLMVRKKKEKDARMKEIRDIMAWRELNSLLPHTCRRNNCRFIVEKIREKGKMRYMKYINDSCINLRDQIRGSEEAGRILMDKIIIHS